MPVQVAVEKALAPAPKKKKAAKGSKRSLPPSAAESIPPHECTPAKLHEGFLLLLEFSRPGGVKYVKERGSNANKRVVTDSPALEKWSGKLVNQAYNKLIQKFPHVPWGFFCLEGEVTEAYESLTELKTAAEVLNKLAFEMNSDRRVRLDIYPTRWHHEDPVFQRRVGEMIASKLIGLREIYTSRQMWAYRVRMDRVLHMDKLVKDKEQKSLIRSAIDATEQQRRIMVAKFGDKTPAEWLDPRTGELRTDIVLDFEPINAAIKHFYPAWEPPPDRALR